jgi:hypothetical protein
MLCHHRGSHFYLKRWFCPDCKHVFWQDDAFRNHMDTHESIESLSPFLLARNCGSCMTSVSLNNKRSAAWDEQDHHIRCHLESTDYQWLPLEATQSLMEKPSITSRGKMRRLDIIGEVNTTDGRPPHHVFQPTAMNSDTKIDTMGQWPPSTASILPLVHGRGRGVNCSRNSEAMDNSAWCMNTTVRAVGAIVGLTVIYWLYRLYAEEQG